MDQFYQVLRKIQKQERNNGTLARVDETFYNDIHEYMNILKQEAINDPFSKAPAMLKEAQIIATDICQRREIKITNSAVLNIHRSYHLFTGSPKFDLVDTTPLNLTPEEEKFYYSLIETLKNHRDNISMADLNQSDDLTPNTKIKPIETQTNTLTSQQDEQSTEAGTDSEVEPASVNVDANPKKDDEVLERLDDISKAKVVPKEEPEPIEKQIAKSQKPNNVSVEDNPNAFNDQDEFYDLESQKIAKDTELVTMLVYDEIGPIVGVDEQTYGPFRPQDLVTLPMVNAKIFFKNRKGRQVKI